MIRHRWLAYAQALSAVAVATPRARLLSSTSSAAASNGFNNNNNNNHKNSKRWTVPGSTAENASPTTAATVFTPLKSSKTNPNDEFARWRMPRHRSPTGLLPHEQASRQRVTINFSKDDNRQDHMLIVGGLSSSLRSSDFARLAARDLSDWSAGLNEVHQERDPWTLDPLGNYRISFASHAAAIVYQAKLDRVFRLAQLKLRSKTGLWTNSVPSTLRGPASVSPEEEVEAFTIAPGSLAPSANRINARLSRVKGKWPWQHLVNELVRRSGFTVEPAVVLLHMHNSTISATDLQAFIDTDSKARNEPWATSNPYHLATTLHENQSIFARNTRVPLKDDHAFRQKLRNRFLIVCKSPDVAWRFIRSWNQRTLTREVEGQTQRTVLTASFVEI